MVDQLNPKSKDNIMRLQQESARVPSGRKSARVQRIELEDRIRILKMQVNELTEQLQRYSEDLKIKDDTIKFLQVDKERIVKITESNDREIISEEIAKLRHQLRIKDDEVKKEHEEVERLKHDMKEMKETIKRQKTFIAAMNSSNHGPTQTDEKVFKDEIECMKRVTMKLGSLLGEFARKEVNMMKREIEYIQARHSRNNVCADFLRKLDAALKSVLHSRKNSEMAAHLAAANRGHSQDIAEWLKDVDPNADPEGAGSKCNPDQNQEVVSPRSEKTKGKIKIKYTKADKYTQEILMLANRRASSAARLTADSEGAEGGGAGGGGGAGEERAKTSMGLVRGRGMSAPNFVGLNRGTVLPGLIPLSITGHGEGKHDSSLETPKSSHKEKSKTQIFVDVNKAVTHRNYYGCDKGDKTDGEMNQTPNLLISGHSPLPGV